MACCALERGDSLGRHGDRAGSQASHVETGCGGSHDPSGSLGAIGADDNAELAKDLGLEGAEEGGVRLGGDDGVDIADDEGEVAQHGGGAGEGEVDGVGLDAGTERGPERLDRRVRGHLAEEVDDVAGELRGVGGVGGDDGCEVRRDDGFGGREGGVVGF